jgi:hypothetical protein
MAQAYQRKTPCLPDRIYLIDSQGRYYSVSMGYASFEKTEPDYECEVMVEYLSDNPEQFCLRSYEGAYFEYYASGSSAQGVLVSGSNKPVQSKTILFTLLDVGVKDTFVFRTLDWAFVVPQLQSDPNLNNKMDILRVTRQPLSA